MAWFGKRKESKKEIQKLQQTVSVEVERHKDMSAEAIEKAKRVTDNFNRIIKENGFTLMIHVAAGGKHLS